MRALPAALSDHLALSFELTVPEAAIRIAARQVLAADRN